VLGLWLDAPHGEALAAGGFDGFYTYFASDGFSFGATSGNWRRMCSFARGAGLACTLSVGPGYQDDKIRPWNGHNTQPRREGGYYDHMWRQAVEAGAEVRCGLAWPVLAYLVCIHLHEQYNICMNVLMFLCVCV
jgi:glycoprotein endo-alpha-1,2-mannosidase